MFLTANFNDVTRHMFATPQFGYAPLVVSGDNNLKHLRVGDRYVPDSVSCDPFGRKPFEPKNSAHQWGVAPFLSFRVNQQGQVSYSGGYNSKGQMRTDEQSYNAFVPVGPTFKFKRGD